LLVRTLLATFPHPDLERMILGLKTATPLVIEMKGLVTPRFGLDFEEALAYAMFCKAHGHRANRRNTMRSFSGLDSMGQSPSGMTELLIEKSGGSPVVLVLDDLADLAGDDYGAYFPDRGHSRHQSAIARLSHTLQLLHGIKGCFVYCTGGSFRFSSKALAGSGSQLHVTPTLLQPLTTSDIIDAIGQTKGPSGRFLLESIGVAPGALPYFADRVQRLTGGMGRAVQYLLRKRQQDYSFGAALLRTQRDIDGTLDRLAAWLSQSHGMLRMTWDGPAGAVKAGNIPSCAGEQEVQLRLLHLFVRMMLLDSFFPPDSKIPVGDADIYLLDAAVVLGLCYAPAVLPTGAKAVRQGPDDAMSTPQSPTHLRLIAGEYWCRSLADDSTIEAQPAILASVELLAAMRSSGCTMRGRPFEMLCVESLLLRSSTKNPLSRKQTTFGDLIGKPDSISTRSVGVGDPVPPLSVVALPRVSIDRQRLDDSAKARIMQSSTRWTGPAVINTADLSWVLSEWLPLGSLGVPADAQSGSQDVFLGLDDGVVGFALKAASASAGTDWSGIRVELSKAPKLTVPYTLVMMSLQHASQLQSSSVGCTVYASGKWRFARDNLPLEVVKEGDFTFEVRPGDKLVITNPHHYSGEGLKTLLGEAMFKELQSMSKRPGDLSAARLTNWIMQKSVVPDQMAR
jgi:hypothetical protein